MVSQAEQSEITVKGSQFDFLLAAPKHTKKW